ncbi:MAG: uroporphyrinogen-III synthase [Planctomycetota bacterium]
MSPRLWIVASAATAARWAAALADGDAGAEVLAWSETACIEAAEPLREARAGGAFDLLLLTSPRALCCLPPGVPRALPVACVGRATARAAREAGLEPRWIGAGTGADLARSLAAERPGARVLFLRGRDARREAVLRLQAAGSTVVEVVVYEARPRAAFAAEVARAPEPPALVVGRPRGAEALAVALDAAGGSRFWHCEGPPCRGEFRLVALPTA